jgi:inhibitor of KinA sporulation pathway (predicted exonuclease)
MGLFGKLFGGGEKEYPALDPASTEARCIEKFRPQLEALVKKVNDRYEAVPGVNAVYVFLGSPPGMFGVAWFLDGDAEEHNLKKLIQKRALSPKKSDALMQKLRAAYSERENEPRYSIQVAGKKMVVAASESFAGALHSILHFMDE